MREPGGHPMRTQRSFPTHLALILAGSVALSPVTTTLTGPLDDGELPSPRLSSRLARIISC
jgi:hypothetical protein